MKNISVVMAAYNGEKYIRTQIESILTQLSDDDELIVSLDTSTDKTEEIIRSFSDPRIQLIQGPNQGVVSNFEHAINQAKNEIIFLSDQDDVWMSNKVDTVLSFFDEDTMVVLHDCQIVDEDLHVMESSYFHYRDTKLGIANNVIKNSYIGACMAFHRNLLPSILPFPRGIPMHDQWIGLMGEKKGKNRLCDQPLIQYRRHKKNMSQMKHSGILQMIRWRISILLALLQR